MNIEKLNEIQLKDLQSRINEQLLIIEKNKRDSISRKDSVKHKTKLNQLTANDRIFGISIVNNKLYDSDYCDVKGFSDEDESGWHRYSFSHKSKPLGCSSGIHKDKAEKGYCLFEMCGNYYFWTLNPKAWEIDLKEALNDNILEKKKYQKQEIEKIKNNIESIIKDKNSKKSIENSFQLIN